MSRVSFISAFSLSIALIGGALWFRFSQTGPTTPAQIVAVQNAPLQSKDMWADYASSSPGATLPATSATELSQTDLLSRQLFADYLTLKSQGRTTPDNISALADKYAENIKNIEVALPKANANQIVALSDSEESLIAYGDAMTNIRDKYKDLVTAQTQNNTGNIASINSPAFSTFMGAVGKLYLAAANELLMVKVPASLVSNHINLINYYLETAEVMKLIGNVIEDPTRGYAALNIYTKNIEQESKLLLNIQKIMTAHGIIFSGV